MKLPQGTVTSYHGN